MRKFGVRVPDSIACATAGEVQKASEQMKCLGDDEVVVKSQILAGGRGLGTFKSGFKGGVHIVKNEEARETAEKMLGNILVTKQSGPEGKPVNAVLVSEEDEVREGDVLCDIVGSEKRETDDYRVGRRRNFD